MGLGDKTNATKGGVPWHVSVYDITLISGFQIEFSVGFRISMNFIMIRFLDFKDSIRDLPLHMLHTSEIKKVKLFDPLQSLKL